MVKRSVGAAANAGPAEGNKRKKAGEWDGRRRLREEERRGARRASALTGRWGPTFACSEKQATPAKRCP